MSSIFYLRQQYTLARVEAIDQVAYMDARNEEQAERAGGADALEGPARTRYLGIRERLIKLAAADRVTADYVAALEAEVGEALRRANQAEHDLRELKGEILEPVPKINNRDWLGMILLGTNRPYRLVAFLDSREARRSAIRTQRTIQEPHLF